MSEPDSALLNRAAACYQRLGVLSEAARCYRDAGSHRRAAELHERLGRYRDAATDHARAENHDLAAWLLMHYVGDAAAARERLAAASATAAPTLRRRLVEARCDAAENLPPTAALATLAAVMTDLARPRSIVDPQLEPWGIGVAEALGRPDQVALIFAAAVRGGRIGAENRWRTWMRDTLHAELILPAPVAQIGG